MLAADPPRASSLIVTVWGDAIAPASRDTGLWLRALIPLMAPFGINERLVRTSVYRLAQEGWLAASTLGRQSRYRLTPAGRRRFADAYRRIYTPHSAEWQGDWQVLVVPPETVPGRARDTLRDELAWIGFGLLAPGVHVRPATGDEHARPPGLPQHARVMRFEARDLANPDRHGLAHQAETLWDLKGLSARYRRFLAHFGPGIDLYREAAGEPATPEQCFVARTLLIHAFRRALLRDPLLPTALLPLDWPGAAAYALTRDFYRLVHRGADVHLAATLGGPPRLPTEEYRHRFGGLDNDTGG
jgi:phenylacetic acid degradation operon negative regulatory protein